MPEEFIEDIIAEPAKVDEVAPDNKAKEDDQPVIDSKVDDKVADTVEGAKVTEGAESSASVEALAEKLGWNKNHQGDGKVDAVTYILRSREIQDTMRDNNNELKGQVGTLKKSIDALQEHNEKVYQSEVKKLKSDLTALKKEKREAVELADVDKVDELDEQIESIQKDLNKPQKETEQTTDTPVYGAWLKDNQWYVQDEEMAAYANTVAEQYEGAPIERIYTLVSQKVKEVFPDKFQAAETSKVEIETKTEDKTKKPVGPTSPVESATNNASKETFTVNDLSDDQRMIMKQFVAQNIMTEKQYVEDIAKLQEG